MGWKPPVMIYLCNNCNHVWRAQPDNYPARYCPNCGVYRDDHDGRPIDPVGFAYDDREDLPIHRNGISGDVDDTVYDS